KVPDGISNILARTLLVAIVLLATFIATYIVRRIVDSHIYRLIRGTRFTWDNVLMEKQLFMRMTLVIPGLIIYLCVPLFLDGYEQGIVIVSSALNIYFILVALLVTDALINALLAIYETLRVSRNIPLKSLAQVLKIILYCSGLIMVVAVMINRSPMYLLSGFGAMTAVLMLVFKDPIMGFAAGVQLTSNRMLKKGDWIEMPKYGANGEVMDITLTTVKVMNWDNTITTIPTYALINDAFKNWRGMQESDGRRIKRAIYVDMNSITLCTSEMITRFSNIRYIADYMEQKKHEIEEFNTGLGEAAFETVNLRQLTNIGTFRAYAFEYLRNHPKINTGMTCMVRQLAPTEHGLPLEIYAFCADKRWVQYESVQSDIFDHLLAIA
ncbi:MAG: mechanosensitive ion channel family protein, partial [Desulfobacterales bacterium]|nr:mechanosensitive ion channel family protein [Desulfobacterales bacterium]